MPRARCQGLCLAKWLLDNDCPDARDAARNAAHEENPNGVDFDGEDWARPLLSMPPLSQGQRACPDWEGARASRWGVSWAALRAGAPRAAGKDLTDYLLKYLSLQTPGSFPHPPPPRRWGGANKVPSMVRRRASEVSGGAKAAAEERGLGGWARAMT